MVEYLSLRRVPFCSSTLHQRPFRQLKDLVFLKQMCFVDTKGFVTLDNKLARRDTHSVHSEKATRSNPQKG